MGKCINDHSPNSQLSVPTNAEKYLSIGLENLTFIDSYQIIPDSLENHRANLDPSVYKLIDDVCEKTVWLKQLFTREGVYPHE